MSQKIVIKFQIHNEKSRTKAMKIAAVAQGVKSVSIEGDGRDQVVVTGDGVDSVQLTNVLRKKLRHATLMSVQDVKLEDKKDEEDKKIKPIEYFGYYNYNPHPPNYSYQVVYDPYHNNCSIM